MGEDAQRAGAGGPVTWLLVLVGVVLVVLAVGWWRGPAPEQSDAAPPTPGATEAGPQPPPEQRVEREPGAPVGLTVPELGIRARIVPIGAPGGVLTPPADPRLLGWWADGAAPGASLGSALVTGHTVHTGGGALDDLEQLEAGARVWVRTEGGRLGYDVRSTVVLGKGELARRAQSLFDQEVPGRLVLVTCEDWDGTEYLSNVVVTAVPRPDRGRSGG